MLTPNYQLKQLAFESLRGKWWNAILAQLLFLTISLFSLAIPFGVLLIQVPLSLGLIFYFMNIAANNDPNISSLFTPFKNYGNTLLIWFLKRIILLLAAVPLIILVLIVILISPVKEFDYFYYSFYNLAWWKIFNLSIITLLFLAIYIWILIRLFLVYYIYLDYPNLPVDKAIGISWKAMKGKELKLTGLVLSFLPWWILGLFTFGIAYLWLIPYFYTSLANFYFDVRNAENLTLEVEKEVTKEEMPLMY